METADYELPGSVPETLENRVIKIPEIRRPDRIVNTNQNGESGGVFRLTQRQMLRPRRIRKRQMAAAWTRSPFARSLGDKSLKDIGVDKVENIKEEVIPQSKWDMLPQELSPSPVKMLSPRKATIAQHKFSPWTKFTDRSFLSGGTGDIVKGLCAETQPKVDVANRQKNFARRFKRSHRIQPMVLQASPSAATTLSSASSWYSSRPSSTISNCHSISSNDTGGF